MTGVTIYDQSTGHFQFHPGPVFASVVLADEINRASPKTQSALLEVMEENRVTVDTTSHHVGRPFMVIATQNPIEQEGTYPLPEAQLDRFLMKTSLGYPDREATVEILSGAADRDDAAAFGARLVELARRSVPHAPHIDHRNPLQRRFQIGRGNRLWRSRPEADAISAAVHVLRHSRLAAGRSAEATVRDARRRWTARAAHPAAARCPSAGRREGSPRTRRSRTRA